VCSTRGNHSGRSICPTRAAVLSDDDGGYLREQAAAYFAHPLRLPRVRAPGRSGGQRV